MERIFGRDTHYGEETLEQLKQVMLVTQQDEAVVKIYGKTGMGKDKGIVVDSWFTGFGGHAGWEKVFLRIYRQVRWQGGVQRKGKRDSGQYCFRCL